MSNHSSNPRRDQQLARIIEDELRMILGSAGDVRLQLVEILRVEPKPGGRHFLVVYGPPTGGPGETPEITGPQHVRDLLAAAHGYIRSELASSLNLRLAPDLLYVPDPLRWAEWKL